MNKKAMRFHEDDFKGRGIFERKAIESGVKRNIVGAINFFKVVGGELVSYGLTPTKSTWVSSMNMGHVEVEVEEKSPSK